MLALSIRAILRVQAGAERKTRADADRKPDRHITKERLPERNTERNAEDHVDRRPRAGVPLDLPGGYARHGALDAVKLQFFQYMVGGGIVLRHQNADKIDPVAAKRPVTERFDRFLTISVAAKLLLDIIAQLDRLIDRGSVKAQ